MLIDDLPDEILDKIIFKTNPFGLWVLSRINKVFRARVLFMKKAKLYHDVEDGAWIGGCKFGCLSTIRMLHIIGIESPPPVSLIETVGNTTHIIFGVKLVDIAAKSGSIELVKWLHRNLEAAHCSRAAVDYAAEKGDFEMVKFLTENYNFMQV